MANENDELLPHNRNDSKTQNNSSSKLATETAAGAIEKACAAAGETEKTTTENTVSDNGEGNSCLSVQQKQTTGATSNEIHDAVEQSEPEAAGAKGKLNDLVADLYISSMSNGPTAMSSVNSSYSNFGDYKNIRATAGPGSFSDSAANTATVTSVAAASTAPPLPTQNTFSFKHFLSSGANSLQAPSSTVTSLDLPATCAGTSSTVPTTSVTTCVFQSSTGARPKVPQSTSSSLAGSQNAAGSGASETMGSGTKMKRSPRFSSFDSQASLAGATAHGEDEPTAASSASFSGGFRLHPESERVDIFSSQRMQPGNASNIASSNSSDYDRRFVPRSYSHYDMQMPASMASPRRRMETIEARPNRLSLAPSSKQRVRLEAHCFPGELPAEAAANRSSAADFPAAAAAAALPDFVQDHWLDSWYASEMHLNSPPNSPVCDFVQDLPGGGGAGVGGGGNTSVTNANSGGSGAVSTLDVANPLIDDTEPPTQRLPDFLSDGPIIHSSQRLADVTAGLPSNTMSSPEEVALKQQLSALRIENDRQRRELSEARLALTEQTRRANELERQLLEAQRTDAAYNRSSVEQAEENLEQSKRRHNVTLAVVRKLKQQVKQLTSDIDCLRRENEVLRDESAVGGCSSSSNSANCDRPYVSGAGAAAFAAAASVSDSVGVGATGNTIRPSRSQQISRDLLRAASNAEHNLRQLLTGVDNLRQMAADIEQAERVEYDVSPDLFSDFLDECDDYEEYPGGPAL